MAISRSGLHFGQDGPQMWEKKDIDMLIQRMNILPNLMKVDLCMSKQKRGVLDLNVSQKEKLEVKS